jgi:DNA-binding transcriptional LysR family regulator
MLCFIKRSDGEGMDRIMAAMTFNRICELGSLSAAARSLGISRPMVSRYLDEMEKWAGARLIHRSTRRLTLTPAGEKILEKTRQLASLSQDIEGDATRLTPSGTLRIACAHFTATHLLGPVIPSFLARYPALRIEVDINNQPVSLVGERIDLAIRITNAPEPGVIARALGNAVRYCVPRQATLRRPGSLKPLTISPGTIVCITAVFQGNHGRFAIRRRALSPSRSMVISAPGYRLCFATWRWRMWGWRWCRKLRRAPGWRVDGWSAYCRNWSRSRWAFMGYINPAIISMRRSACFSMQLSSILPLKPGSVPPSTAYVLCPAPGR